MNTPVLDTRRLTANNQVARLKDGVIKPFDFDFRYMRFNLGRYGYEALLSLKDLKGSVNAVRISIKAAEALRMETEKRDLRIPTERERTLMLTSANVMPDGQAMSEKMVKQIVDKWGKDELSFLKNDRNYKFSFIFGAFAGENTSEDKDLIFVTQLGMVLYKITSDDILKYSRSFVY
jgi:hypothetical protein